MKDATTLCDNNKKVKFKMLVGISSFVVADSMIQEEEKLRMKNGTWPRSAR
jgi:hypothetical protein